MGKSGKNGETNNKLGKANEKAEEKISERERMWIEAFPSSKPHRKNPFGRIST